MGASEPGGLSGDAAEPSSAGSDRRSAGRFELGRRVPLWAVIVGLVVALGAGILFGAASSSDDIDVATNEAAALSDEIDDLQSELADSDDEISELQDEVKSLTEAAETTKRRTSRTTSTTASTTTTVPTVTQFPTSPPDRVNDALGSNCPAEGARVEEVEHYHEVLAVECRSGVWTAVMPHRTSCTDLGDRKPAVDRRGHALSCHKTGAIESYEDLGVTVPADGSGWTEMTDGNVVVGDELMQLAPGTYVTEGSVRDCYWERVSEDGSTIDNDFVVGAPQVRITIAPTDAGFNSEGCGRWLRQ